MHFRPNKRTCTYIVHKSRSLFLILLGSHWINMNNIWISTHARIHLTNKTKFFTTQLCNQSASRPTGQLTGNSHLICAVCKHISCCLSRFVYMYVCTKWVSKEQLWVDDLSAVEQWEIVRLWFPSAIFQLWKDTSSSSHSQIFRIY